MGQFDDLLRIRIPSALSTRLETVAQEYARKPSDVVREGIVLHLDRLVRNRPRNPVAAGPCDDWQPPEAA